MMGEALRTLSASIEKQSKKGVFVPRIPDFLSRFVALSNFLRLSLRGSRTRGRR
jgi:hypothetical protein